MYNYPYMVRPTLFNRWSNMVKGFSWSGFLDGTQKTLGVINQAIPLVSQVKPVFQNARTLFRIADEIRKPSEPTTTNTNTNTNTNTSNTNNNKPIFYM